MSMESCFIGDKVVLGLFKMYKFCFEKWFINNEKNDLLCDCLCSEILL